MTPPPQEPAVRREAAPVPLVSLSGITRRFGPVTACDNVSLDVQPGTIHGLVGENGAGKSTLMRILYGLERPDAGRIAIDGRPVEMRSPGQAHRLGIGMVHQHFMLVKDLAVLDNVILGDEPCRGPFLDRARARRRLVEKAGAALAGLDLDRPVGTLPLGLQQRVEIVKLLYRDARLLILDEPTAVLAPEEVDHFFAELRRLRDEGRTILLITHKLREIFAITRRVSVMRQGRLIATRDTADVQPEELAREIVGGETPPPLPPPVRHEPGPAVLELAGIEAPGPRGVGGLRGLSLAVHAGEILAVAGVEGNGQSELARIAAGREVPRGGRITAGGEVVPPGRPAPSAPARVGYIPEDRQKEGLVQSMSAAGNLLLGRQREARFTRGLFIDRAALARHAAAVMARHDVRPADPAVSAGALSGGNQQKLVVGREVEESPRLVVASHPTRGLDLKATRAVHDTLRAMRDAGAGVLLITADLDEARLIGDRLVVLFEGRVAGELRPEEATDAALGLLMTGGSES